MTNADEESLSKAVGMVLLGLCLLLGAIALAISSLFILSFWHIYWIWPGEGWQAPLFLTGLWLTASGVLSICAVIILSQRSPIHISMAIAVMISGLVAVAVSYV